MALEAIFAYRAKVDAYRNRRDTVTSLLCGSGQQVLDLAFNIPLLAGYAYLQSRLGISTFAPGLLTFVMSFILIDAIYYLYHRLSHSNRLLWSVHEVHHQSTEYNFSVGLRQAWFHKPLNFPIYLPPALIGIDAKTYVAVATLHASLQIWTHTKLDPKLPNWVSKVFVTPSHHRVHHGTNAQYYNRNFGGIFSFWDRAFGSYQQETEPVRFGLIHPRFSYDVLKLNVEPLIDWATGKTEDPVNATEAAPESAIMSPTLTFSRGRFFASLAIIALVFVAAVQVFVKSESFADRVAAVLFGVALLSLLGRFVDRANTIEEKA